MSDYLSRAAERASRTPTGVRPLLPSFSDWEKSPAGEVATTIRSAQPQEDLETKQRSNVEEETGRAVAELQARVTSILSLTPPDAPVERIATTESSIAQPRSGDGGAEIRVRPRKVETPGRKSSRPPETRPQGAPPTSTTKRSAEPRDSTTDGESAPAHSAIEPPGKISPQHSSVRARPAEPARVISHVSRPRSALSPPMPTAHTVRRPDRESSSRPTIEVTIGRLEVRAVQSGPAPSQPRPKSSRISLEEYLRSRNGGAR